MEKARRLVSVMLLTEGPLAGAEKLTRATHEAPNVIIIIIILLRAEELTRATRHEAPNLIIIIIIIPLIEGRPAAPEAEGSSWHPAGCQLDPGSSSEGQESLSGMGAFTVHLTFNIKPQKMMFLSRGGGGRLMFRI